MPVRALDFSRADRQLPFSGSLIIQMGSSLIQIAVRIADGSFPFSVGRLKVRSQAAQHFAQFIVQQPAL